MDKPFLISLVAVTANLVAMVLIYSLMANALLRLRWRGRGIPGVIALIFVAGLFWIVPPFAWGFGIYPMPPDSFWFGNWLVSGCSVIILNQRVQWIPRELDDLTRTDGCSWLGTYWYIALPLVRRELILITLLTVMATFIHLDVAFASDFPPPIDYPSWVQFLFPLETNSLRGLALAMVAGSLVMSLPVILIFLLARRCLDATADK